MSPDGRGFGKPRRKPGNDDQYEVRPMNNVVLLVAAALAGGCEVHVNQGPEIEYLQTPGSRSSASP